MKPIASGAMCLWLTMHIPLWAQTVSAPDEMTFPKSSLAELSLAGSDQPALSRFAQVRRAYAPSASPDGKSVAFQSKLTGQSQLWVVSSEGGWPKQLTFGESVMFHEWSPTGNWIIYGADRNGDERTGYFLISPDGKVERELLPPSDRFRMPGGFTRDGKCFVYAASNMDAKFDIHTIDIASGSDQRVLDGSMGLTAASCRPDGDAIILSQARGEDANDVYLLDLETQALTPLLKPGIAAHYASFQWVPDGSGFYLTTNEGREFEGLAYYSIETCELTYLEIPTRDIESVRLSNDGVVLAWIVNEAGNSVIHARRLFAPSQFHASQPIIVPDLPQGIRTISWAPQCHVATITIEGPQVPGDIWTWNADTGEIWRTTKSTSAGLDMSKMVVPQHCSFKARDGVMLHGLFYPPRQDSIGEKPPVLLHVHGGPTGQARPEFSALHQYLLTKGFAVFDLNYRGSTGYGKSFARMNNHRLRVNELWDLVDAIDWLNKRGLVDAKRAAIMGNSYGGYLAMAAMSRLGDYFDAGVAIVGVSNWITALENAPPLIRASDRIEYGDINDPADRAFFKNLSPMSFVDKLNLPMIVIHGANDSRVPVAQSDQFVRSIRERGGRVEYLRFPDEGHEIRKLKNRISLQRHVAQFLCDALFSDCEDVAMSVDPN